MPRILVADDSDLDLHLTRRALAKALPEWEIEVAIDGNVASEILSRADSPGLVFLDFKMPGMGAIEILKGHPLAFWQKVPTVVFSSAVSPSDVARCKEFGARQYVEKPTDPSDYATAVLNICKQWTQAEPSSE